MSREIKTGRNPRDIKVIFAQEIVTRFHSSHAAQQALSDFEARFQRGALPEDMPEVRLSPQEGGLPLAHVLKQAGLVNSTSEALRMVEQGGVRIDGDKVSDKALKLSSGTTYIVQVGKRKFARIIISG